MQNNSKPGIHNYEEHIVNYLDGKSSPIEVAELFLFLETHPELSEDLANLCEMVVEPDLSIIYDFKDALKLNHDADAVKISSENFLHYFTAFYEGDLSQKGMKAVNLFVHQNAACKNELLLLEKCKIEVPQTIIYPNKSELKRKRGAITVMPIRWAALVASVLLLFSIFLRLEPITTESLIQTLTKTETPFKEKPVRESVKNTSEITGIKPDEQPNDKADIKIPIINIEAKQAQPAQSIKTKKVPAVSAIPLLSITANNISTVKGTTRHTYSSLFDDISLSQQIMLAYEENHSTDESGNASRPGLNVGRRFNQYLQTGTQVANQVSESFNGWMLADLGIKGINFLTDKDLKLVREVHQDGATGNVMLKSDDASYLLKKASL